MTATEWLDYALAKTVNVQEEMDYNTGLLDAILDNVHIRIKRGGQQDLRNYLQELPAKYSKRPWIIEEVLHHLAIHAPKELEWFQKVLLLQP